MKPSGPQAWKNSLLLSDAAGFPGLMVVRRMGQKPRVPQKRAVVKVPGCQGLEEPAVRGQAQPGWALEASGSLVCQSCGRG